MCMNIYIYIYVHDIGMKFSAFIRCYTFTKSDFKSLELMSHDYNKHVGL